MHMLVLLLPFRDGLGRAAGRMRPHAALAPPNMAGSFLRVAWDGRCLSASCAPCGGMGCCCLPLLGGLASAAPGNLPCTSHPFSLAMTSQLLHATALPVLLPTVLRRCLPFASGTVTLNSSRLAPGRPHDNEPASDPAAGSAEASAQSTAPAADSSALGSWNNYDDGLQRV